MYEGPFVCETGWNTFVLDSLFEYNGQDNLLVAVLDESGAYNSLSHSFRLTNTNANMALEWHRDNAAIPASNPDGQFSINPKRNNIRFLSPCLDEVSCVAPNLFVHQVGSDAASVTIVPGADETAWEVEYKHAEDTVWTN